MRFGSFAVVTVTEGVVGATVAFDTPGPLDSTATDEDVASVVAEPQAAVTTSTTDTARRLRTITEVYEAGSTARRL